MDARRGRATSAENLPKCRRSFGPPPATGKLDSFVQEPISSRHVATLLLPLPVDELRKLDRVAGVARNEAPRLRHCSMKPLEAEPLHDPRRASFFASEEIDRRSDAERHGRVDTLSV